MNKSKEVSQYIKNSALSAQPILNELRDIILNTVEGVEEKISYGIPFYKYHGELVGFAAYKRHVSFGYGKEAIEDQECNYLIQEGYVLGKGTMQIHFNQQIPVTTVVSILKRKAKMNEQKDRSKKV